MKVQDSSDVINEGRVRVVFTIPCEPQLDALIQNQHVSALCLLRMSVCACPLCTLMDAQHQVKPHNVM